jgi:hypothetical protein
VRSYTRLDTPSPIPGLFVRCHACGEELWSSLVGVAMAMPEVRELRRRRPRVSAALVETRDTIAVRFGPAETTFARGGFRLLRAA